MRSLSEVYDSRFLGFVKVQRGEQGKLCLVRKWKRVLRTDLYVKEGA